MQLRNRLLAFFVGISLFGIILLGLVTYNSALETQNTSANQMLHDFSEYIAASLKRDSLKILDTETIKKELAKYSIKNTAMFVEDEKGNFIPVVVQDNSTQSIFKKNNFKELISANQISGNFYLADGGYSWTSTSIPGAPHRLLMFHKFTDDDPLSEYFEVFGVPFFITGLVITWIAVWGALILSSLFRKLEIQNLKLESQTKELAEIKDSAISANQAKSAFLANMSHEIRTPLTAIVGFSESLLLSDQSNEDRIGAINTIIRGGNHLMHLINGILDLSKIEANKLEIEHIDMSLLDLLVEIETLVHMQAKLKGLAFKFDYQFPLPKNINSDPVRVRQILINLCNNAIKFTDVGFIYTGIRLDNSIFISIRIRFIIRIIFGRQKLFNIKTIIGYPIMNIFNDYPCISHRWSR
jgi:hypothetical protein